MLVFRDHRARQRRALSWPAVRGAADAQQGADPDEFDVDWLDADMMPADIVDVLRHLKFDNGKATLQVDRPARDYLIASVTARHLHGE
jgi:hypothetical protein